MLLDDTLSIYMRLFVMFLTPFLSLLLGRLLDAFSVVQFRLLYRTFPYRLSSLSFPTFPFLSFAFRLSAHFFRCRVLVMGIVAAIFRY